MILITNYVRELTIGNVIMDHNDTGYKFPNGNHIGRVTIGNVNYQSKFSPCSWIVLCGYSLLLPASFYLAFFGDSLYGGVLGGDVYVLENIGLFFPDFPLD
jgi:hypothetical protein